jgi:hypothetical protein
MSEKKDSSGAPQHECLAPTTAGAAPGGPSIVDESAAAAPPAKKSCLKFLLEIIKSHTEKAKCL